MIERKSDADDIKRFLEDLSNLSWLGPSRQWWPKFAFHFTAIQNTVKILESGKLVSRKHQAMTRDTGSSDVLGRTQEIWKDHVRLYFRPRTPTQYQTEGFRPKGQQGSMGQHMPVPVFFLFSSKEILTRKATQFSKGNMAQNPEVGGEADFLKSMPFKKIYHEGPIPEEEKPEIKLYRHAEILVPHELDLNGLHEIWCRSQAEYQTLWSLLSPTLRKRYSSKIRFGNRPNLFFCRWSFVDQVSLMKSQIVFKFNPGSCTPGPFHARLELTDKRSGQKFQWEAPHFQTSHEPRVLNLSSNHPSGYSLCFTLDNELAYEGTFEPDIPF